MKIAILTATVILAGCAAPQPRSPHYADCAYQAKLATPGSNNVFADVMREQELTQMCIANKSR